MFKQVMMSVQDFAALPDNPIQRDSQKHGEIYSRPPYGHLCKFHPTHIKAAMCITPDGKHKWKLDGHTRVWCIENDKLDWPKGQKLAVDVWIVKDEAEAIQYYETFDGFSGSKETGTDKLFGAFRVHGFVPNHPHMFRETGLIGAMNHLVFEKKWGRSRGITHVQLTEPWVATMKLIDESMSPYHASIYFPGSFTAALLCTVRCYGIEALPFWQTYHDRDISRSPQSMCGAHKAHDLLFEFKNPVYSPRTTDGGKSVPKGRRFADVAPKVIYCCEQWMKKKRFKIKGGKKTWEEAKPLIEWWQNNLGEFDHPEFRQPELDLE